MTGVSRSGRVRKKSSKLMDFQSPDDIDATKSLKRTSHKSPSTKTSNVQRSSANLHTKSTIKAYFQPIAKPNHNQTFHSTIQHLQTTIKNEKPDVIIDDAEKEIDRLLSPNKYDDAMNLDNNNDIESDDEFEMAIDTTMRKSAYMSEKSSKKKVFKDGEIVMSRPQRKDKGKPRFTAYMLWSKEIRQEMLKSNPNMDFSQASRRLSSMWANVPNNEKNIWRRRAKRVTIKIKRALKSGEKLSIKYLNKPGQKKPGRKPKNARDVNVDVVQSPTKKTKTERKSHASTSKEDDSVGKQRITTKNTNNLGTILPGAYKVTGTSPTDVAAHLKLLGDNLAIIGQRLKEHEVNILSFLNHF